ncbi:MAG: hypothetical protein CVV57_01680 [Tenericutes bacterium HGW-Tenericutes-2]|jgi:6-pyruvoyl-tetrahydropterin synthase|nr:MAG: hypothetical protein CVV57_01680 [Tenericutes bacterium HGW-Tenericutes-2]
MVKLYNSKEIEKKVRKIRKELDIKIVRDICEEFDLDYSYESRALDDLHKNHFGFGFCHVIWRIQKKILKQDYNIDWMSPTELNPFVCYD